MGDTINMSVCHVKQENHDWQKQTAPMSFLTGAVFITVVDLEEISG